MTNISNKKLRADRRISKKIYEIMWHHTKYYCDLSLTIIKKPKNVENLPHNFHFYTTL